MGTSVFRSSIVPPLLHYSSPLPRTPLLILPASHPSDQKALHASRSMQQATPGGPATIPPRAGSMRDHRCASRERTTAAALKSGVPRSSSISAGENSRGVLNLQGARKGNQERGLHAIGTPAANATSCHLCPPISLPYSTHPRPLLVLSHLLGRASIQGAILEACPLSFSTTRKAMMMLRSSTTPWSSIQE